MNLCIFIRRDRCGNYDISSNFGRNMKYIWYSKRESVRKYREMYGLKGKHLITFDYTA